MDPRAAPEPWIPCGAPEPTLDSAATATTPPASLEEQNQAVIDVMVSDEERSVGATVVNLDGCRGLVDPSNPRHQQAVRDQAIRRAIRKLDRDDYTLWLADGRPQVFALNALLVFDVDIKERDEIWTDMTGKWRAPD